MTPDDLQTGHWPHGSRSRAEEQLLSGRRPGRSELRSALRALWEVLRSILGNLRDMDALVSQVLDGLQCEWKREKGRFSAIVKLPEGRSQRVYVEVGPGEPRLGKLVRIYSICAPLNEGYYRRALELNTDLPHGCIAIQDLDGKPHFIMVDTYPQATCDPEEIRRSVLALARWSDDVERVLTQRDRY